ncbi:MAG: hypothetical protein Q4E54_03920 [Lachnospiraceae bacterium]|nr:hypothetical protein [Lachnospiraceae bacterium]
MTLIKNKTTGIIIQAALWILTIVSTVFLLQRTQAGTVIRMTETAFMIAEVLVVALWFFLALYFVSPEWISWAIIAVVAYVFLWIHRIAMPVLVSGLYIFYLIVAGEALLNTINPERNEDRLKRFLHDFVMGSAVHLTVVCLINVFGTGGIAASRIVAIAIFTLSAVYIGVIRYSRKRISIPCKELPDDKELKKEKKYRAYICLAVALLLAMILLQAGRINITLDYDSLHYGLRSKYILDSGNGIYENLGSVNDVYVYPKGLETLVLPLVTDVTYGYVLSFSWWMSVGILVCIYCMVKKLNCRRAGVYAAMFAAAIPGIMNMGISAKTDVITVFIQLLAIIDILNEDYVWAGTELLFSLIFKPTGLLFSGVIFIVTLLYVIITKRKIDTVRWYISIPVILAFGFITARTIMLTGFPVTAAASKIWSAIGFLPRYPFNNVEAFGKAENVSLIKRLIGFFFCPVTDDLFHVYIAWGGIGTAVMLFFGFLNKGNKLLKILTGTILAVSIVCILTLYQVDGNYFMILYALADVLFFASAEGIYHYLLPVLLMNIMVCTVTNWSGSVGLTPDRFLHLGFYDHESDAYDNLIAAGNKEIYDFLARDSKQRVIAFADQPQCFGFRCIVQSYTDIEGSGGNVYLVKTLDLFKEFLDYAKTDYIYVNDDFLASHSRAGDIIEYMIEDGSLREEIDEGSNRLYEYIQE